MRADGSDCSSEQSKNNKVGGKNGKVQVDGLEFSVYTHPSFNCINLHSNCTLILDAT